MQMPAVITRTYSNGPAPNVAANLEPGDVVTVVVTFNALDLNIPLIPYPDNGNEHPIGRKSSS